MAPESTTEAPPTPPEFIGDDHRDNHVAALVNEKAGYEAKAKGFDARGDKAQTTYYSGRADEVQAELDRLSGEARTPRQRASSR